MDDFSIKKTIGISLLGDICVWGHNLFLGIAEPTRLKIIQRLIVEEVGAVMEKLRKVCVLD